MTVDIEIPGPPQGKGRPRRFKYGMYTPKKTVEYEKQVRQCFIEQQGKKLTGPIVAIIIAVYKIPESWSKEKRRQALRREIFPAVKPDTDNIAKVILDSLNGLAYDDDKQVTYLVIKKQYDVLPSVQVELEGQEDAAQAPVTNPQEPTGAAEKGSNRKTAPKRKAAVRGTEGA
jgi:Holliday junction resolvase RusA-like endonuclease